MEDLFNACVLTFDLESTATVIASTQPHDVSQADEYCNRRKTSRSANDVIDTLTDAADQFIVAREQGKTVIAGYHWFADWGRDTMIALPGLTLTTGRIEVAKSILREFANQRSRDGAYHQGTVWPWLMGPYITAYSKTFGTEAGHEFASDWFAQFQEHLSEECLGQVSEIFDGDAPHRPRGCVAQAWSVSELLRAAVLGGKQDRNVWPIYTAGSESDKTRAYRLSSR